MSSFGTPPIIFDLEDMKREMLEALERGSHPNGRLLNGRIVVILATPDNGTSKDVAPGSVIYTPSMARHRRVVTGDEIYLSWWMYSLAGSESRWLPSKGFKEPI